MFPDFLGQWFPRLPLYQHHLGSIIKYRFSAFPSHLWSQNLSGWGLEIWILTMSQGESDAQLRFGHPILGNHRGNANTQHPSFSLLAGIRLTLCTLGLISIRGGLSDQPRQTHKMALVAWVVGVGGLHPHGLMVLSPAFCRPE